MTLKFKYDFDYVTTKFHAEITNFTFIITMSFTVFENIWTKASVR